MKAAARLIAGGLVLLFVFTALTINAMNRLAITSRTAPGSYRP